MTDERTIVADMKSWIDELSSEGFSAEVEEHEEVDRTDLRVYHKKKILFNGEFKKPYTIEGRNARSALLVKDARDKAEDIEPTPPRFFVTSNFNETIIWDNSDRTRSLMSRDVGQSLLLPLQIKNKDDFLRDDRRNALKYLAQELARRVLDISKERIIVHKPLGQSFIGGLNSHLDAAVKSSINHIHLKELRKWWLEQGYLIPAGDFHDEHKERMARYSFYVLANRIIFYYVLRRSFKELREIPMPSEHANIGEMREPIKRAFDDAKRVSGDFETVFEEGIADFIPFSDDEIAYPLRSLLEFIRSFDFSNLSQDILGNIYDTLISPRERHDNGQYYTPIPVVDLVNALAIKHPEDRVMDPACGSGTFLTRAFDLKLNLMGVSPETKDKNILQHAMEQLFGVEIANYPAHLATIALSSKILFEGPEIYPRIVHDDFLNIRSDAVVPVYRFGKPKEEVMANTLSGAGVKIEFKPIDALVGNLPYVRQEEISNKDEAQNKIRKWLEESGFKVKLPEDLPSDGADFHTYFWYYSLPFLREGSRVGFLTSDTWLNVGYGQDFKKFINKYFKIVAVIDSSVERWFEDALVNTVITILERTNDEKARKDNRIKFVRIDRKIADIITDIDSAIKVANSIETGNHVEGVRIMRGVEQGSIDFNDTLKSKFFPYLRAPDDFFRLVNSVQMAPFNQIMGVQRGFTTGANAFFYVEDVTEQYDSKELHETHGLRTGETRGLRVIRDGEGVEHVIEKQYLKPLLKSPREFTSTGKLILSGPTKKLVVLIKDKTKDKIKKYALKYIKYGERKGYSKTPTCTARNPWWKLSPIIEADVVLPDLFNDTFLFPTSNHLLDHKLYFGVHRKSIHPIFVRSFLNSSLFVPYADFYGRNTGGGATELMVYEYQLLPIPSPDCMKPFMKSLEGSIQKMESREVESVFEEIWDGTGVFDLNNVKKDRLELDKIVLRALGFENVEGFLKNWYPEIVKIVKERLDKAASLKTANGSHRSAFEKIAIEIVDAIEVKKFPEDYVKSEDEGRFVEINSSLLNDPGKEVRFGRDLNNFYVSIDGETVYFDSAAEAEYVYYCALEGHDKVFVPKFPELPLRELKEDVGKWNAKMKRLIDEQTENENYREKLTKMCRAKAGNLLK